MEDYIRNRNQEDKIFINHNTCQREIEYNSIDDVIEFREYLSEIKDTIANNIFWAVNKRNINRDCIHIINHTNKYIKY